MLLKMEGRFPVVRDIGEGQMYLTNRRFLFIGPEGIYLDASLLELDHVATDPGGQFYFTHLNKRYLIVIRTESILKWSDTVTRLMEKLSEDVQ